MPNNISQKQLDEIITLSKEANNGLDEKISKLIKSYNTQKKQNNFFLKQWDKRNILSEDSDKQKDKMLEHQSRMAAMGEMMDAVAHQWKQPLNSMSIMSDMLKDDYEKGLVDKEYILDLDKAVHTQIEYMVNTLSEFRNFFRPSTRNEMFTIQDAIDSVQILMKDELISQNIHLYLNIDEDINIYGNINEIKHLFINLINNSIDAFNERNINNRNICIRCYDEKNHIYIEVEDNAGGISQDIIDDIFKPNVTTKEEGKGTGIGLYMSLQIVKKIHGHINVHNSDVGAFFTIALRHPTIKQLH